MKTRTFVFIFVCQFWRNWKRRSSEQALLYSEPHLNHFPQFHPTSPSCSGLIRTPLLLDPASLTPFSEWKGSYFERKYMVKANLIEQGAPTPSHTKLMQPNPKAKVDQRCKMEDKMLTFSRDLVRWEISVLKISGKQPSSPVLREKITSQVN